MDNKKPTRLTESERRAKYGKYMVSSSGISNKIIEYFNEKITALESEINKFRKMGATKLVREKTKELNRVRDTMKQYNKIIKDTTERFNKELDHFD